MADELFLSRTLTGTPVADILVGGETGQSLGRANAGFDGDITELFGKHDSAAEIFNLAVHLEQYAGSYGGDYTAAADLAKIIALGDAGYGLLIDFRWNGGDFTVSTTVKTGDGDTYGNRLPLPVSSMSYNNAGTEIDATTPVAGTLGEIGDTVLGDRIHFFQKVMIALAETELGRRQWDTCFSYNVTP